MAREFSEGSTQYMEIASLPVSAWGCTMSAWVNNPGSGDFYGACAIRHAADFGHYFYIGWDQTNTWLGRRAAGGEVNASTTVPATDVWSHIAGTFVSNTEANVFINGGGKATDTNSVVFPTASVFSVGRIRGAGDNFLGTGRVAEVAIWDVVLTDDEIALLAKGFSARLIRPDHLKAYIPMIGRYSPELDFAPKGAFPLTLTNAPTAYPHPRIFYSYPTVQRKLTTAAAGFTAEVDSTIAKVTAALNASQRQQAELDSQLVRVTASINAYMRPDATIASTIAKVTAALNASQRQQMTVTSTLRPGQAAINVSTIEARIDSDLVRVGAALNVVMVPAATIASTLVKLAANINAAQDGSFTLTVASTLVKLSAALNASQRQQVTIDSDMARLTANLNAAQRQEATLDADLVKVASNVNLSQSQLITLGSTLAKVSAALRLSMLAAYLDSDLSRLTALINVAAAVSDNEAIRLGAYYAASLSQGASAGSISLGARKA